jgi:hypothetical protein
LNEIANLSLRFEPLNCSLPSVDIRSNSPESVGENVG